MKNLRKVLCLVLAVVMVCSLTVFASAKDFKTFTDADKISSQYTEAVDVVSALGIFAGNDDGSLNPQGTFTRAQAAKIVTYLSIGATAAERLTPNGGIFKDVPASHWASKYIAYAYEAGILSGDGDGNYRPEDAVKGSEVAKLMNTVLGYGKKGEYTGASWEIHAISDGVSRGLITGTADLTAPALREEVIQYVFNTIRPYPTTDKGVYTGRNFYVEYSSIVGAYVAASGSNWTVGDINKVNIGGYVFGIVCNGFTEASGYPVHNWRLGANIVTGTYPDAPPTYHSTNGSNIYTTLSFLAPYDLQTAYNLRFGGGGADIYYNGYLIADDITDIADIDVNTLKIRTAYLSAKAIVDEGVGDVALHNYTQAEVDAAADYVDYVDALVAIYSSAGQRGVIVDIYLDGEGYVNRIVMIEKTAAKITAAPTKAYGAVNTIGGITAYAGTVASYTGDLELVKDDVVLWYKDSANIVHVQKVEPVEGQLTRYTTASFTVAFGGKDYSLSGLFGNPQTVNENKGTAAASTDADLRAASNYNKDGGVIYLDDNGSIFYYTAPTAAKPQYMYVLAVSTDGFGNMDKVRAVFPDGTIKVVTAADANANYPANLVVDNVTGPTTAQWFSYTFDEATGIYTLKTLAKNDPAGSRTNVRTAIAGTTPKIQTARTAFLQYSAGGNFTGNAAMLGDSSTVFVFYNPTAPGSAKAYVGINKLPNIDLTTADLVSYINIDTDVYADFVLIETAALGFDSTAYIFALNNESATTYFGNATIEAFKNVIINGEVVKEPWFYNTSAVGVPSGLLGLYTARTYTVGTDTVYSITSAGTLAVGGTYSKVGDLALQILNAAGTDMNPNGEPFNVLASLPMYLVSPANLNVPVKFDFDSMELYLTGTHYNIYFTTSPTNANQIVSLYFVPSTNALANAIAAIGTPSAAAGTGITAFSATPGAFLNDAVVKAFYDDATQEGDVVAYVQSILTAASITNVTATAAAYVTPAAAYVDGAYDMQYTVQLKDAANYVYNLTFTVTGITIDIT